MKKKIIWGVIAVVIIIAALMGILYFTTDMFKSPEQLFYKHLADNAGFLGKTTYADVMKELKKEAESSSENAGEITAKITGTDANVQQIGAVLEKGKITYNMKTVGAEKKMQGDITLNYDGKDIVTVNLLKNQDQYGIKVAEAYDKYISVENNNLKALFQKLGADVTNVPNKIEMVDYFELLNIDEATLKHIEDNYAETIKQNIPAESYSVEKNVTFKFDDMYDSSDVTTNAYKVTLTEEQVKTVLTKILETLKLDDTTLNLIVSKYNAMMEPYKAMEMKMTTGANEEAPTEITKDSLVKAIEDELQELNKTTAGTDKALEIISYGAKDGKAKIEVNFLDNTENIAKIGIGLRKNDEGEMVAMTCTAEDTTMKIWAADKKDNTDVVQVKLKAEDTEINSTVKTDKKTTDGFVEVKSDGTTVALNFKNEVKATENVTVDNFTTENSVKLNDMTQTEMQTLVQTIAVNVQKVLPQKAQLLGINL